MIKSLLDARLLDAIPRVLSEQDWVKALSDALALLHQRTLALADQSQIYTALDTTPEPVLDALAGSWRVEWYDYGYDLEKKRRILKTALTVRRLMGTAAAAKLQAEAVYPGTTLAEWFEHGGPPGTFRLYVNAGEIEHEGPLAVFSRVELEQRLTAAKRWSAHLEQVVYRLYPLPVPAFSGTAAVGVRLRLTVPVAAEGVGKPRLPLTARTAAGQRGTRLRLCVSVTAAAPVDKRRIPLLVPAAARAQGTALRLRRTVTAEGVSSTRIPITPHAATGAGGRHLRIKTEVNPI
ncbi:MAG: phage tail protein I [Clostridia bacterium]|nr:phage tail protein I [Clostridia bacterium]